jgi:glutamate N-acetyltransferase/amino-acid N-acetyltransferase
MLIATGAWEGPTINSNSDVGFFKIRDEVTAVCENLAKKIVLDGEGATKFIELRVEGGLSVEEARDIGFSVANSPLVKTAFYASDPNLGRIMSAIGAAGVKNLDVTKIEILIGDVVVAQNGGVAPHYRESEVKPIMDAHDIVVTIKLNRGQEVMTIWTCDLSYDYIKINAEYRS